MNLRDLTPKTSSATMGKLLESYFQKKTRFSALNESAAKQMLTKVNKMVAEYKATSKRHNSEKDQTYLGLMFMQEGLKKRLSELAAPAQAAKPVTAQNLANPSSPGMKKTADAIKGAQTGKALNGQQGAQVAGIAAMKSAANPASTAAKNPAFKKAAEKGVKGQPLNPAESSLLAQVATEGIEDRLEAAREKAAAKGKKVNSGEQQAQTDSKKRFVKGKQYGAQQDKDEVEEGAGQTAAAKMKHRHNQASADSRRDQAGFGKKIDDMKKSVRAKDARPQEVEEDSFDDAMADFRARGGRVQKVAPGSAKNPINTASRHISGKGEVKRGGGHLLGKKAISTGGKVAGEVAVDEGEGHRQVTKAKAAINTADKAIKRAGVGGRGKEMDDAKKGITAKGLKKQGWAHDAEKTKTAKTAAKGEMKTAKTPYKVGGGVYESFNNLYHRFLAEGADVDQAQVVLAAQDMVDSVQDMLEKVGKMKIDELYPLTDSIKSSLGTDKAAAFSQAVDAALQTILDSLQGARTELSNSVAALTGEEVDPGFADAMGGDDAADLGLDAEGGDDAGMGDIDPAADLGLTPDAEAEPLGRERR